MIGASKVSEETSPSGSNAGGTPKPLDIGKEGNSEVGNAEASVATLDSLGTSGIMGLGTPISQGHPNVGVVDWGGVGAGAGSGLAGELASTGEAGGRGDLDAELSPKSL